MRDNVFNSLILGLMAAMSIASAALLVQAGATPDEPAATPNASTPEQAPAPRA